ncbi:MAG TPA: hypothetical protein VMW52_10890 [Phycisphaerae bacterium]|nr:hypothetical protein [Phycisphaerae bacterium]
MNRAILIGVLAFAAGLMGSLLAGCSVTTYSSDGQARSFQSWRMFSQTGIDSVKFKQGVNPDGTPIVEAELSGYTSDQSKALDLGVKALEVAARIIPGAAPAAIAPVVTAPPAPNPAEPAPVVPNAHMEVPSTGPPRVVYAGPAVRWLEDPE